MEGSQYRGQKLPLKELPTFRSDLGIIMKYRDWDSNRFHSCTLITAETVYWNSKQWVPLFSGGRMIADLKILRDAVGKGRKIRYVHNVEVFRIIHCYYLHSILWIS